MRIPRFILWPIIALSALVGPLSFITIPFSIGRALAAIAEDPVHAEVHAAAREALRAICGSASQRW